MRLLRLFLLPAVFAMLAAACAQATPGQAPGGGQQAPALTQASGEGQALQCEPGKEHWRAQGQPVRGGTLVRGSNPFAHLDITVAGNSTLTGAAPQVNQPLMELRGCYYEDLTPVPALAKSWEISPDGRTWTIKLREGVKWHNKPPVNGRPFTSADVAWTIDYQKAGGQLRPYFQDVTHETPDAHTIVLRLKEPNADFLAQLSQYQNVMLAREVKEQHGDFKSVAVGTGPFMLKDFKQTQELVIERNPDYYEMGADGKPLPYIDTVRTLPFSDNAGEAAAIRTGQLDTTKFNGLEKHEVEGVRQANPKVRAYEQIVFTTIGLWFDLNRKPLDDVRVRRAMAMALDPEDLIARYQGGAVRSGFVPAFMKDYAWSQEKLKEKFTPNQEAAKKLLAEAGFKPGDLKFGISTANIFQQDAEVAQKHLQDIGVETTISVDNPIFSPIFNKSEFELAFGSPGGVFFPSYWMHDLMRSNSAPKHLKPIGPEMEAMALAQAKEVDPAKRKVLIDQMQDKLYDLMPFVPQVSRLYYHMVSCRVRNASQVVPSYNPPFVREAWLDPSGC